ncbi:hypothetical protein SAMN03159488_01560 [Pseudomonas sp. NFIX10]|nr:hypothetical protein SAMN03159488_01560 [Pseudomonas sp. NFIX10]SFE58500.1 hypothetical protein SAMN03159367_01560 [Pseudomonas sp. NFACC06-1]
MARDCSRFSGAGEAGDLLTFLLRLNRQWKDRSLVALGSSYSRNPAGAILATKPFAIRRIGFYDSLCM